MIPKWSVKQLKALWKKTRDTLRSLARYILTRRNWLTVLTRYKLLKRKSKSSKLLSV